MKKLVQKIKENKGVIVPIIILLVSLVIFGGGLTYAFFEFSINTGNVSSLKVTGTNFEILLTGDPISVVNANPIYDEYKDNEADVYNFSVSNQSRKVNACYGLTLNVDQISEGLLSENLKWELINNDTNEVNSGNFLNTGADGRVILKSNIDLSKNSTASYSLKIWLSYSETENQISSLGGNLSAKLNVDVESEFCGVKSVAYFAATGLPQVFSASKAGTYKVELWGSGYDGNYGSYTSGKINLSRGDILFVYVGNTSGFNNRATDIRLASGNYNNQRSLSSRIMVASGADSNVNGGGLLGNGSSAASQINGNFGPGAYRLDAGLLSGSSYISGHTGCIAITSSSNLNARLGTNSAECLSGTSDNLCSIHYSSKSFTETVIIDGNGYEWSNVKGNLRLVPKYNEVGYFESGTNNASTGYAKITLLDN